MKRITVTNDNLKEVAEFCGGTVVTPPWQHWAAGQRVMTTSGIFIGEGWTVSRNDNPFMLFYGQPSERL